VKDLGRRLTWLREEGLLDDFPIAISLTASSAAQMPGIGSLGADQCVDALTPLCQFLSSNVQDGHILIRLTFPGLSESGTLKSVRLFGTEVIPALLREVMVNEVAKNN
jgi:hypothetical protein